MKPSIQENSWLFVYSIKQRLEAAEDDPFDLPDLELVRDIKEQIAGRMRLVYHMPIPLTVRFKFENEFD
jgi:hypothetical protein